MCVVLYCGVPGVCIVFYCGVAGVCSVVLSCSMYV